MLASLLCATALPGIARAQEESAPLETIPVEPVTAEKEAIPKTSEPDGGTALDMVVVEGKTGVSDQRKLAETVDVLSGEQLEDIGARSLEDYLNYVPGITMQPSTSQFQSIAVRGVGPQQAGLATNQTVGILINDVPMSDPIGVNVPVDLDPYDLRNFEVLKGPQGTLFGASALGGAIRYVPQKPMLHEWSGKGFVDRISVQEGGSAMTYGAAFNVPVGNTMALRAAGVFQDIPGLYDDVNVNKNIPDADTGAKRGWRVLGTWQPGDRFSLDAMFLDHHSHRDNVSVANNDRFEFVRTNTPGESYFRSDVWLGNLEARYHFDWATLVSSTARSGKESYLDLDAGGTAQTGEQGIGTLRASLFLTGHSTIQELRLQSPQNNASPWEWVGGVYYFRYRGKSIFNTYADNTDVPPSLIYDLGLATVLPRDVLLLLAPSPQGASAIFFQNDPRIGSEGSLFGEVSRKFFSDRFKITLGGRLYRQKLTRTVTLGGALVAQALLYELIDDPRAPSNAANMQEHGFNPKISVSWQVTDDIFWYATAAKGFQFGGINNPAVLPTTMYPVTYKPSTLWSYETGIRTDWFHRRLALDVTPYVLFWKDLQIEQDTPEPAGSSTYTANVSKARAVGVEGSLRWALPIRGLILAAAGTYSRATVTEPYTLPDGRAVPEGSDLPASPHVQTTTTLSWSRNFDAFNAGAGFTWQYQGPAFNNITHDVVIFDYHAMAINLNLGLPRVWLAPEITLNVTNALDADGILSGSRGGDETQGYTYMLGFLRPRAINLRITGRFWRF